jgi:hypothetical protein
MANLSIIYKNIADQATIVASTTASGFSATNLQNTQKTSVHRSTGNTVAYTLTWDTAQSLNALALPATNLQDGATIRVQLFDSVDGVLPIADTGALQACKGQAAQVYNTTGSISYVDFGFGGATKTSVWLNQTYQIKKALITLTNNNTIDCARIICGQAWKSERQVNRGIELGFIDSSDITTTRSGNTYADRKPIQETMRFDLEYLSDADRSQLQKIMRSWGSNALLYVCVFPDNTNPELTQTYSIYGRSNQNAIQYQYYGLYSSSLDISSW